MIYFYIKILSAQEILHHPSQLPPISFIFFFRLFNPLEVLDKISEYVTALNGVANWGVSVSQEGKKDLV